MNDRIGLKSVGWQQWVITIDGKEYPFSGGIEQAIRYGAALHQECLVSQDNAKSDREAIVGGKKSPKLSDVLMGDCTFEGKQG